ncbi:DUF4238 domain-containing protein [Pedobacter sp. R-06]|uniref:DUF4238 domain-containing protein n=1 Tax=Pedobacter sp. R-06 TaxID=3404051 RepID=UPI003CE7949D
MKVAQHYVPQSYLKKFYDNDKLWVLDFEKLHKGYSDFLSSKVSAQICRDKYFYNLDEDFKNRNPEYANLDEEHIENETFKRLENQYARTLYNSLVEKLKLTSNECDAFADFIIQMKIRNPYYRNNDLKNNGTRLIDIAKEQLQHDNYYHERFRKIPTLLKNSILEFVMDKKYNGENFERNIQLSSLIKRENDRKTSTMLKDALRKHPWTIAISKLPGNNFLTTDNPGASVSKQKPGIFNTKFNEDFTFYFPLSPNHCLIIDGTTIDVDFFYDSSVKKISMKAIDFQSIIQINNIIIQTMNGLAISNNRQLLDHLATRNRAY